MRYRYLLLCWVLQVGSASADDFVSNVPQITPSDMRKAEATKEIFALTYNYKKMCRYLGGGYSELVDIAVDRFRNAYPEVMRLVNQSPYLPVSEKDFEDMLNNKDVIPERTEFDNKNTAELIKRSCRFAPTLLNSLADKAGTPAGNKIIQPWISDLQTQIKFNNN